MMDKAVKEILEKCYADAVKVIEENIDDMHKVVAYLLEKETITGGEMVAILEGRDPATVEDAYASTRRSDSDFRPSVPSTIEAPARHISMTSEKIEMPPLGRRSTGRVRRIRRGERQERGNARGGDPCAGRSRR